MKSAIVALSGGVDSGLLAFAVRQALGDRMKAVMGVSPSVPARDRSLAHDFCRQHDIPFEEIATDEFSDDNYRSNPQNRCFFCKNALFRMLRSLANARGFHEVLDGTNASDAMHDRPGTLAAKEWKVRSPLREAHFTKEDVRQYARECHLDIADKPAAACLASRIPTHTPIEPALLSRIDEAENALRDLGLKQIRVRHHGDLARIEVDAAELSSAVALRTTIHSALSPLGWKFITLDLMGYRSQP